jgi:uncharacterized protein YqeY
MDTKLKLQDGLKDAMRAGDEIRKRNIRLLLAAVKLAEVEKGEALDEASLMALVQKEIKSRRESIQDAQRANRPDLIAASEADITFLETYLPKALSQDELLALAREVIVEVGAGSLSDMGKVMKVLLPRLQGRAAGDQASQAVRQLLQNP